MLRGVELSSLNGASRSGKETGLGSYDSCGTFTPTLRSSGRARAGLTRTGWGFLRWNLLGMVAIRGGASLGGDLYQGGAYHCHVAQFVGQMLQAVLGQLEGSQGAIQLLLGVVAPLLLRLECLLHLVAMLLLAAGSREVQ